MAAPPALRVIKVPDVGEGIAEVELVAWHVAVGQSVVEDQPLAEVMTDKASVEIPSPVAGRVLSLGGVAGQMLAVGSELIRIETGAAQAPVSPVEPPPAPPTGAGAGAGAGAAPAAAPPASGLPAPQPPAALSAPAAGLAVPAPRPIASPAVRRRAWELGLDLAQVAATGTAGRIVQADLDRAVAAGLSRPMPPVAAGDAGPSDRLAPAGRTGVGGAPAAPAGTAVPTQALQPPREDVRTIPVIGLRRRIALRMQEAKRRIPHFSYVEELDVTAAEALRATLNARWAGTRGKLTLLPLLMRAVVLALQEHPALNAHFDDDAGVITRHGAVHLGIATQTAQGLLVPVVRQAQTLDLWGLATAVSRLAERARAGQSTREELSGSTLTISSLGALGGIVSTPVINRPEVAIVGVNRIVERPVVERGQIVVRQTMNLSSSFDHRVVDGADAAAFIQAVRARIEQPALLFVA